VLALKPSTPSSSSKNYLGKLAAQAQSNKMFDGHKRQLRQLGQDNCSVSNSEKTVLTTPLILIELLLPSVRGLTSHSWRREQGGSFTYVKLMQ
jgi:hypothetical protein